MSNIYFLVGPTATGKSRVAQYIAEKNDCEILSADSMLIYKSMNIGTAKPTVIERAGVVYHGIDLVEATERFSVADFRNVALKTVESVSKKGKDLIVAGGTGLYIKSLTDGLAPSGRPDPETRKKWQHILDADGITALQKTLRKTNPALYESLSDKANPRRLIRALEKSETGFATPDSTWKKSSSPLLCGLFMPAPKLSEKIAERVESMYAAGLLDEVRTLREAGLEKAPTALQGIGYAEALDCLENKCTVQAAKERTAARTRRLAKRQMTWFRNKANIEWINICESDSISDLAETVMRKWKEGAGRIPAENILNFA